MSRVPRLGRQRQLKVPPFNKRNEGDDVDLLDEPPQFRLVPDGVGAVVSHDVLDRMAVEAAGLDAFGHRSQDVARRPRHSADAADDDGGGVPGRARRRRSHSSR